MGAAATVAIEARHTDVDVAHFDNWNATGRAARETIWLWYRRCAGVLRGPKRCCNSPGVCSRLAVRDGRIQGSDQGRTTAGEA